MNTKGDHLQDLMDYLPALSALVVFVAGYADLKANQKSIRNDVDNFIMRYDRERQEDSRQTREMFREIRGDIKTLLNRGDV